MTARAWPAVVGAVILALAGCGESSGEGPGRLTLRDYLETTPAACGLGRQPLRLGKLIELPSATHQIARVRTAVERLRGLTREREIRPAFVSRSELEARLSAMFDEELGERDAALAERALRLLGAVPASFDLRKELVEALTQTAGGFYDPERKQLVVARTQSGKLNAAELEALAHELEHALSDERLGLPEGLRSDGWGDTELAAHALIEGSATVTELRFLLALLGADAGPFLFGFLFSDAFDFPGLPHYVDRGVAFPYVEGLGFVCRLYERGGWKAVDAAYERPPRSSAEILFPERYVRGEQALRAAELARPGTSWLAIDELSGNFGAADLVALFEAPGDELSRGLDRPLERAAAWGGGRIEVWARGSSTALGISLVERGSRGGLCESVVSWYGRAFPSADRSGGSRRTTFVGRGQAAVVRCRGAEIKIGIAPDDATAGRLAGVGG